MSTIAFSAYLVSSLKHGVTHRNVGFRICRHSQKKTRSILRPNRLFKTHAQSPIATLSTEASSLQDIPKIWSPNVSHTAAIGGLLARNAYAGDVILLHGELGAGKTALARGYIHQARRDSNIHVTSPTYLLVNTYPPDSSQSEIPTVYHMDLWRIKDVNERSIVDFKHVFQNEIALVEWSACLGDTKPDSYLDVHISYPPLSEQDSAFVDNSFDAIDSDDPWGFGDDDPDNTNRLGSGRFLQLVPHGTAWESRVKQLFKNYLLREKQSADEYVLSPGLYEEVTVS